VLSRLGLGLGLGLELTLSLTLTLTLTLNLNLNLPLNLTLTLTPQAYGSNDMRTFNLTAQRAVLILCIVVCVPVTVLWWFSCPGAIVLGFGFGLVELKVKTS
jgi:Na+-driven multidrug efflux pump